MRDTLLRIAPTLPDTKGMFGPRNVVADPSRRLIGALRAGAATRRRRPLYLDVTPARNDGKTIYRLNIKVVPVDGFWSISVGDGKGYSEPNPLNA